MIKVNKKVSVLLAIVMVLAVLPMTASAFSPSAEAAAEYEARWDAAGYTTAWAQISQWFPGTTATGGPGAAPVDDVDDGDDDNGDVVEGDTTASIRDTASGIGKIVTVESDVEGAVSYNFETPQGVVASGNPVDLGAGITTFGVNGGDTINVMLYDAAGDLLAEMEVVVAE